MAIASINAATTIDERPMSGRARVAIELLRRRKARRSLLDFMKYAWVKQTSIEIGLHTRVICERLTKAVFDLLDGKSTYLCIKVPFRHGKSTIVSQYFPAWFLGVANSIDPDVILSGYGAHLVESFSRKCRDIVESRKYQTLFPDIKVSESPKTGHKWGIEGSVGEVTAVGLGGAITGTGGHLISVDDYCKSREEAESEVYRDKMWESFCDSIMTRQATNCIVIVTATPWHMDDIFGRIEKEKDGNEDFPNFETLCFPAKGEFTVEGKKEKYTTSYLFPERFSDAFYKQAYATLGPYSAAGLLDCNPTVREGAMFTVDNIRIVNADQVPDCPSARAWDLASSEKERAKDDPDFTVGAHVSVSFEDGLPIIWVRDVVRGQWKAPKRNKIIEQTMKKDGVDIPGLIESVAGYKDTAETFKEIFKGKKMVTGVHVSTDKVVRAEILEAPMVIGNIRLVKASWNDAFIREFREFPKGAHDCIVDTISMGARWLIKRNKPAVETGAFEGAGVW